MTIHRDRQRSLGWNYLGIGAVVALILFAVALVGAGAFELEFSAWRPLGYLAGLALIFGLIMLAQRRRG